MDINGKVAVVTGGASGIGQAVTRRIAAAGGKVVIFDLNEDAGQEMVVELGGDNCVFAPVRRRLTLCGRRTGGARVACGVPRRRSPTTCEMMLALLVLVALIGRSDAHWSLNRLDKATYPLARCLDGSQCVRTAAVARCTQQHT